MDLLLYHNEFIPDVIVRQAARGNISAQEILYRQYARAMFNICVRLVQDQQLAKDILHDAFVIAFRDLTSLRNDAAFGGWLKKIVIRQCLKQLRRNKLVILDTDEVEKEEKEDNEWFQQISFEQIQNAISQLPEGCRQVFTLYAIEDWSHKDIAGELKISESTSKSQYQRARKLLKEKLLMHING